MKPVVGITMGDPSGNGPELCVRALMEQEIYEVCRPVIIGDACCLWAALETVEGAHTFYVNPIERIGDAVFRCGTLDVIDLKQVEIEKRLFWKDREKLVKTMPEETLAQLYQESDRMCGEAAFQYVRKVIELAMSGEVDATVTNAINKDRINLAGHHFSGHTEIYAQYTDTAQYTMMLVHENLRVVHVSTHVSLREACDRVKKARVLEVIRIADQGLKELGIKNPRIGVAGLNPHCGENGMFGREEIEEIQPAIDAAMQEGILIPEGRPTPPDTVFSKALGGWYDIVVAMYHDQGHIPLKVKGFVYNKKLQKWDAVSGVNVTLGLPVIRASVDHGTGEDTAGAGTASPASLLNAIEYAVNQAVNHNQRKRKDEL